jgi:hypothetical protein
MMILSQYHIFELDTINIYSVAGRHVTPLEADAYGTGQIVVPNRLCC